MTVKEAWRVERERGAKPWATVTPHLSYETVKKVREGWSVGRAVGTVIGGAIILTGLGIVAKLIAVTWRWILAP